MFLFWKYAKLNVTIKMKRREYLFLILSLFNMLSFVFVKVTRADYLAGRTALHFAAVNGHARCIRLVLADFVPSEQLNPLPESGVVVTPRKKSEQRFFFFLEKKNIFCSVCCKGLIEF